MSEQRGIRSNSGSLMQHAGDEATRLVETNPNILLVDRDREFSARLADLLKRERPDWRLARAESGSEALVRLDHAGFDVIVTELKAAGTDGLTLLRLLRDRYPSTTRVVHSGHLGLFGVQLAGELADMVLAKPATDWALLEALDGAVARRRNAKPVVSSVPAAG